ncbi:hypothetical protein [Roseimaritima ulvae]|uniref:DinB superfamily protein n=1 Tax=Roseimaritima ulvae TaxID=980254 RepID=A0A5B9QL98_9BACT|nr:hypothetical protein [Roseimaritima ulvae]QEG38295.1 hypothetical protein UC8_02510 [Roseimaritima ulvae]
MNTFANAIVDSANVSMSYAKRLLSDVPADQFARLAPGADGRVASNHPAFVYGHLSIYASRILSDLGADAQPHAPSEEFLSLFNKDARCVDDPDGTIYPAMDVITERMLAGYEAALKAVATVDDATYAAPNPDPAMRERFSSMASMHAFYLSGHVMIHMGQVSAWRRMIGLPPA